MPEVLSGSTPSLTCCLGESRYRLCLSFRGNLISDLPHSINLQNPLGARNESARFALVVQLVRVMRDGAAICNRIRVRRYKYHPVWLPLAIRASGQCRALGRYPWVGAVSEHGVFPESRAGAIGEAEAFVVVVDVRVLG